MADVKAGRVRYDANTETVSVRAANDTLRLRVRDAQAHEPSGGAFDIGIGLDELLAWFYPLRNRKPGRVLDVKASGVLLSSPLISVVASPLVGLVRVEVRRIESVAKYS